MKMIAVLSILGVFSSIIFINPSIFINRVNAAGLPAGFVDNYTILYTNTSPTTQGIYVSITHQSSGDLLYIERPEVGGDANCYGDGWGTSITSTSNNSSSTTNFEPAWEYNTTTGWCTNPTKYNLGRSLHISEMSDGISVLQGNSGFNASVYGSPTSNTTSWTSYAQTVEVKLNAYYTQIDSDADGINDSTDNCSTVYNPDQKNSDGNALGDLCDLITIATTVSTSAPAQNTIIKEGTYSALFGAFDLKNTSSVTAPITSFTIKVRGGFDWSQYGKALSNLNLYDSSNTLLSTANSYTVETSASNEYSYKFDLSASPLQITTGTTKTIYVKADAQTSTYTSSSPLTVYLTALTSSNKWVSYTNFPVASNQVNIEKSSSSFTSTSTASTNTYPSSSSCVSSTEGTLSCSTCKDTSGATTSKSCWPGPTSTSTSTTSQTKSCDYSVSSEGLLCMSCKNTAGDVNSTSCWKNTSATSTYYSSNNPDTFYSNNDRYTYGAHCEYDVTKNWCEVCTQSGKEVRNTCTSSTNTNTTNTSTQTTPTTTTNTYASNTCTNTAADSSGMQCSTCTDSSGKLTNKSCWIQSSGSNSTPTTKACDYYTENGLYCMTCKDTSGKTNSMNCWSPATETASYGNGGYSDAFYSNNDRYTKGGRCEYPNITSNTTTTVGYSASTWCEICSIGGKEVKNSCSTSTNVLNTKEVKTLSNFCEYVQDSTTGTYCNICYGSASEVTSKKCDEGTSNTISTTDLAAQVKSMKESLKYRDQDLLEFSRFGNRIDRKIADYQEKVSRINKDFAWMEEENLDTSELDEIISEMESKIAELKTLKSDVANEYSNFQSEIVIEKAAVTYISGTSSKLTWDHTDAAWLIVRRGDKFQALRDLFEGQLSYYEMMDNYLEWSKERAVLIIRYEMQNLEIDSDSESELQKGVDLIEDMDSAFEAYLDEGESLENVLSSFPSESTVESLLVKETRETFRSYFDDTLSPSWSSLRNARETLQNYSQDISTLWDVINQLYQLQSNQYNQQFLEEEITTIKEDISIIEAAFQALTGKVPKKIQLKIDDILSVLPQVTKMLADMEKNGSSDESTESFKRLEKYGQYVDPKLTSIIEYLGTGFSSLKLTATQASVVKTFMTMDFSNDDEYDRGPYPNGQTGCTNCEQTLTGIYGSDVAAQLTEIIREQVMTELVAQLSSSLADSLSEYLDSETAGKVLKIVLENLDRLKGTKVGEELSNQILQNNTTVLDEVSSVDLSDLKSDSTFKDEYSDLKDLSTEFQEIPVPDSEMATQISNYWSDVADVVSDPTEAELQTLVTQGETLYDLAVESKYEYHLGFKDVPYVFDEEYDESVNWYSEYVVSGAMDGRWEGYKDSAGNATYQFGPSDTTLRAEGLKMVLSAYDYEAASSSSGSAWWEGWKETGDDLGVSLVDQDLTTPITRAEIARMIYEAGDMEAPDSFSGYFPDVTESDDWKPIEAAYEAGIFTGDGDTGTFRPYSSLNRAESAAVINRAAEWKGGEEFVDEDLFSYLPWTSRFMARISRAFSFMTNVFAFDA